MRQRATNCRETPSCAFCHDLLILKTVGGQQDNPGSQGETNGDLAAARVAVQLLALRCVRYTVVLFASHGFLLIRRWEAI